MHHHPHPDRLMAGTIGAALLMLATLTAGTTQPNIVMIMADDLGWGDVGYNGHAAIKTPVLDQLAREGLRLDRFYAGAPVCTPTRASCLTGRNAARSGVLVPSQYPLHHEEIAYSTRLKEAGYATGFFGKWHLGKLTPEGEERFSNQKPMPGKYAAPWHFGFDTTVTAEITVPTYNPEVWNLEWGSDVPVMERTMVMDRPLQYGEGTLVGEPMPRWGYDFWQGHRARYDKPVEGDTSLLLARETDAFIRSAVRARKPFLAVVWFFTPHAPLAAGARDRAPYSHLSIREQHAFGAISAMDRAVGVIRETLQECGVHDNTLLWFCSDNGPSWVHDLYSTGPYRGQKADLYEGGIRVPSVLNWPARLKGGRVITEAVSTDDFLPTILAATGLPWREQRPLDGINVLQLLEGRITTRNSPLFFESVVRNVGGTTNETLLTDIRQYAMMDGRWKLLTRDAGRTFQLFDLETDPGESRDVALRQHARVAGMKQRLEEWRQSCAGSLAGKDY